MEVVFNVESTDNASLYICTYMLFSRKEHENTSGQSGIIILQASDRMTVIFIGSVIRMTVEGHIVAHISKFLHKYMLVMVICWAHESIQGQNVT